MTYEDLVPQLADFVATQDALIGLGILKERIDLKAYLDDHFARNATAGKSK